MADERDLSTEGNGSGTSNEGFEDQAPWKSGITRYQWLVLLIASAGWVFDLYEGQNFQHHSRTNAGRHSW